MPVPARRRPRLDCGSGGDAHGGPTALATGGSDAASKWWSGGSSARTTADRHAHGPPGLRHRAIDTVPAGANPVLASQMWIFLGDDRDLEWLGDIISLGGREVIVVALHPSRSSLEVIAVDADLVVEGGGGASARVWEGAEDTRGVG